MVVRLDDHAGRRYPVANRHPDVHQHDLRTQGHALGEGAVAVRRLPDDRDPLDPVQQGPEPRPDHALVVRDDHPEGHGAARGLVGRQTLTA